MIEIVQKAAAKVGGVVALARELGIKHSSLHSWRRVPAERVLAIESASGIPRHELRPDLFHSPDQHAVPNTSCEGVAE